MTPDRSDADANIGRTPESAIEFERYANDVRRDYYSHKAAMFAAAAYAWQLHGWVVAIILWLGLVMLVAVSNVVLLAATGSLRAVRIARWMWVAAAFVVIALSGATIESV